MKIEKRIFPVINIKDDKDELIAQIKDGRLYIISTLHSISIKAIYYTIAYKPDTDIFNSFNIESQYNNYYIRVISVDSDKAQVNIFDSSYNIIFSISRDILKEAIDTMFSIEDKINHCINDDEVFVV